MDMITGLTDFIFLLDEYAYDYDFLLDEYEYELRMRIRS